MGQTKNYKAQAAMEYVSTYGWAFLGIFLVLAFLLGSGALNPSRLSAEDCSFAPNLPCGSYYLTAGSPSALPTLGFNLTNNMGFPIYIQNCSFRLVNGVNVTRQPMDPNYCAGTYPNLSIRDGWLPSGETAVYFVGGLSGNTPLHSNDLRRVYVSFIFRNCADLSASECSKPDYDATYPWHNLSGKLQVYVR